MNEILGYEFRNPALLEEALVTPSCKMVEPEIRDNQRLEFLGDAVLGLLAADLLYAESPREQEGSLTIRRTHMVSAAALCAAAARCGIAANLKRNDYSRPLPANSKTVADAVEAIIGAAWLDGGLEAASIVFKALGLSSESSEGPELDNPKGTLQIAAQAMKPPRHPAYEVLSVGGKSHLPVFQVRVTVDGLGSAVGEAHSRREAETRAAAKLLSAQATY